ncbi:MAG TPA: ATP-binding protein [Thermodesulfobacteriota bacterium]|nr:ATP-binding protein [Thermodesulfobacteriota bacterium]
MDGEGVFTNRAFLLYLIPVLIGALVGILFLIPVNGLVFYYEHRPDAGTALDYAVHELMRALTGVMPLKTLFYAAVGSFLGLISAFFYSALYRSALRVRKLSEELEKDVLALIAHGEGDTIEFKATFKWDMRESRANRTVEDAALKSIAGFMNSDGGTLLIGVSDDGKVTGLGHDYGILRRKDRDGFAQEVMTAVSLKLGADACRLVHLVFHSVSGKDICRIITSPSPRPVYLKEGNELKFYLRTGMSTRALNIQEAVDFIATRWGK